MQRLNNIANDPKTEDSFHIKICHINIVNKSVQNFINKKTRVNRNPHSKESV